MADRLPPTHADLVRWSEALAGIARTGLGFTESLYERERFEEVLHIAGDMRAAAVMQLTLFLCLFLTSAQAPLAVMTGWLHGVARVNPFTNILRLARVGFLGDVTWDAVWGGLVAIGVLGALAMWFARRGLASLDR